MKKIQSFMLTFVLFAVCIFIGIGYFQKISRSKTITSAQLEDSIDIGTLSVAEFTYNGIAEKHNEKNPDKTDCYILYNSKVKTGIDVKDIKFDIDEKEKTITPILPEVKINSVELDETALSYIPQNPNISLKEILSICKEDAMNEANDSEKLKEAANENLKSAVEALLSPVAEKEGYTVEWEE